MTGRFGEVSGNGRAADSRARNDRIGGGFSLSYWLLARLALGVFGPRRKILGAELAGEVEAVGLNVVGFKPGDRVFAATLMHLGGYAEYVCLPARGVVALMPENMSYAQAAVYLNVTTPVRTLAMRWTALTTHKTIVSGEHPPETRDDLVVLKSLIEQGKLSAAIDRRYALEDVVEAHRYVEQGHKKGNVVLTVS